MKKLLSLLCSITIVLTACVSFQYNDTGKFHDTDGGFRKTRTTTEETTSKTTTQPIVTTPAPENNGGRNKPTNGGKQFTIAHWNDSEIPTLLAAFIGKADKISGSDSQEALRLISGEKTSTGADINFLRIDAYANDAQATIFNLLAGGEEIDMYATEADYIRNFTDNDNLSAYMYDLGFSDTSWKDAFPYVQTVGRNKDGSLKGISWNACPGGYAYRTDLAEKYLGVTSPQAMQEKVSNWDNMEQTATFLKTVSKGKITIAASIGGLSQAYTSGNGSFTEKGWQATFTDGYNLNALRFLELIKNWSSLGYVRPTQQWTNEWYKQGQEGTTMGYFVSTWGFDTILQNMLFSTMPTTPTTWNVVMGPRAFFWGGTWLCVNPKTDNAEDCHDFIEAISINETTMSEIAQYKGDFVNNKKVMSKTFVHPNSLGDQNWSPVLAEVAEKRIYYAYQYVSAEDAKVTSQFVQAVYDYAVGIYPDISDAYDSFIEKAKEIYSWQ
ncbi:hypothetical protein FACS1894132_13810 [Clostridia bacterium]|nr:hypothetical protein FACS1894132_13810 [Clostridia bacterium]